MAPVFVWAVCSGLLRSRRDTVGGSGTKQWTHWSPHSEPQTLPWTWLSRSEPLPTKTPVESMCVCAISHFSRGRLFATLWTIAGQAPLFMGFSRQEYFSGLPCPPPGGLPDPGIESTSLVPCIGVQVLYHKRHLGINRSLSVPDPWEPSLGL